MYRSSNSFIYCGLFLLSQNQQSPANLGGCVRARAAVHSVVDGLDLALDARQRDLVALPGKKHRHATSHAAL